ncbi:MAG: NAD-dependent epimerase/dehydratase family protein, partial [Bacteroidia bacterium]
MNIDSSMPVMLTGATGYVGGHIAKKLMENGHVVHAPVRNPDSKEKLKYLNEIAANTEGSIKFFKADLLDDGSYKKAMQGCELVIHTASPFITTTKDPQRDLVDPALKGTSNVMQSVIDTDSVKRVVLTSSCVAMYGDAKDTLDYPDQMMREDIWNTTSSLKQSPYNYSKTVAEKKAWEMSEGQDRFDLVVVNPSFVLGPGINPKGTSESFSVMKQLGDGSF